MTDTQRAMEIAWSYIEEAQQSFRGISHAQAPIAAQDALKTLSLASRQLDTARRHDPNAKLYIDMGDGREGYQNVDQLTAEALRMTGLANYMLGNNKKAVANLERATEYDPTNPAHYSALSDAYMGLGQKKKARAAAQRASELAPDNMEYAKEADRIENASGAALSLGTFRGSFKFLLFLVVMGGLMAIVMLTADGIDTGAVAGLLFWVFVFWGGAVWYWRRARG